ncbi:TetR/AcrR family transcriptional regulator [Patulibacter defluvii]|uniref:TetR/AcrR family transcriptional regulator n=1 Tax=Patulibacter defluvii TaxID=3095358 RepID=UPI002A757CB5|nr:TetR/AcrR family transcriptional regulator [Patulibacter sp. DM4]
MASPSPSARRSGAAARRRDREREILDATRALFDERGVHDAQIEDVARAAGLNRAIIYRHFSGKDELFALTIVTYVEDLTREFAAIEDDGPATDQLQALTANFLDFCLRHPAFIDIAMTMLRQPGTELLERISEAAMLRMGRAVAEALHRPVALLRRGNAEGEFAVEDPDYAANAIYVQILGLAHLARVGNGIRELPGGMPWFFPVSPDGVRDTVRSLVAAMLHPAAAGAAAGGQPVS